MSTISHAEDSDQKELSTIVDRLVIAASHGNAGALQNAINNGAPAKIGLYAVSHVMSSACWDNQVEAVRVWLPCFVPGHTKKPGARDQQDPLDIACTKGHAEIVDLLLPVYRPGDYLDMGLHCASSYGHLAIVHALLDAGANPRAALSSALVAAAVRNHVEIVSVLAPLSSVERAISHCGFSNGPGVKALRAYHEATVLSRDTPASPSQPTSRRRV